MSANFQIIEHTIPCQHIREYPNGTKSRQEAVLRLAIKQYVPLRRSEPREDAVTIIAGHANGFPKVPEELPGLSKVIAHRKF
jgi:hypothetical protein